MFQLYPEGIADSINCGVFTIARCEAHVLNHGRLLVSNPLELRAKYLELVARKHLLGDMDENFPQLTAEDNSHEGESEENEENREEMQVALLEALKAPFELQQPEDFQRLEKEYPNFLQYSKLKLASMGPEWAKFYQEELEKHKLSDRMPDSIIYYLLNLVAVVGCNEVLWGLLSGLRQSTDMQYMPIKLEMRTMSCALEYYRRAKKGMDHYEFRSRIVSVWLDLRSEYLLRNIRTVMNENKVGRRKAARIMKAKQIESPNVREEPKQNKGVPKAATYAPYYFIADTTGQPVNDIMAEKANFKKEKEEYEDIKSEGKKFSRLSQLLDLQIYYFALPTVLPAGKVRSPFDEAVTVTVERLVKHIPKIPRANGYSYLDLVKDKASSQLFARAIRILRPELLQYAPRIHGYVSGLFGLADEVEVKLSGMVGKNPDEMQVQDLALASCFSSVD